MARGSFRREIANQLEERAIGCLQGVATGDAIGKQTETLSGAAVQRWYPGGVTGFHGRPGDVIPRYAGTRYEWRIGETTDDTEQTLAVARGLLRDGQATHRAADRVQWGRLRRWPCGRRRSGWSIRRADWMN